MENSRSIPSVLSPDAPEFTPPGISLKKKKTKEARAKPRKRNRKKKEKNRAESYDGIEYDFDTSDLVEKRTNGDVLSSARNKRTNGASLQEGEYLDWFGSLIGLDNTTSSLLSDALFSAPPDAALAQNPGSSEWLALQAEWIVSKQQSLIDIEYEAEAAERKKWSEWAMYASEMERRRRMLILDEMDKAELRERQKRQKWAASAIEKERNERMSAQFLTNLTSTNWFNETISTYMRDYDVVCPYYKLGCREVCRKTDIEKHMRGCKYAIELASALNKELLVANYEVVCPNSVLGCPYIGNKQALTQHLEHSCEYKGKTRQQEHEERRLLKEFVISECEEERVRRVNDYDSDHSSVAGMTPPEASPLSAMLPTDSVHRQQTCSGYGTSGCGDVSGTVVRDGEGTVIHVESTIGQAAGAPERWGLGVSGGGRRTKDAERLGRKASLQRFMETQMQIVVRGLHEEVLGFWHRLQLVQRRRRQGERTIIETLRQSVKRIWPFATLEVFGSWATGLPGIGSDIDLVVCFNDECHSLPAITGVVPLLQGLANFLEKDVTDIISIKKVLLHTRVPLIKGEATAYIDPLTGASVSADTEGAEQLNVSVDISIDGPEHSGLATTAVIETVLRTLPGIGPVSTLLKEYLKINGLCDAYTGGLPSYGVVLLVLLLFLRRHQATQLLNTHTQSGALPKQLELPSSTTHVAEHEAPITTPDRASNDICSEPTALSSTCSSPSPSLILSPRSTPKRARRQSEGQMHSRGHSNSASASQPSTSGRHCYKRTHTTSTWTSVESQKEFGRRVAAKLLSPVGSDVTAGAAQQYDGASTSSPAAINPDDLPGHACDDFDLTASIDQLGSPILGVVVVEFLGFYGDALECGRHGFSVRDGGFRFEVRGSGPDGAPAHPQAAHPIVIEDPVNVMNNVAKNCYNAASVQRAFVEANERFKNTVTRYSGRAGSALALGRSISGGFIREIFGLHADGAVSIAEADSATVCRTTVSYDKYEIVSQAKMFTGSRRASTGSNKETTEGTVFESVALTYSLAPEIPVRRESGNSDAVSVSSGPDDDSISRNHREAEYKRALNDMLLLRLFNESSDTSLAAVVESEELPFAHVRRNSL